MNDRSTESLLARRAIAEKATPGPWQLHRENNFILAKREVGYLGIAVGDTDYVGAHLQKKKIKKYVADNASHIAANSPDVVMADIDELIRLRADVRQLENEADWLATQLANGLIDSGLLDHLHKLSAGLCHPPTPEMLREAARAAVEESLASQKPDA